MAAPNEAIRPVGRPRATPGYPSEDVAEEILMAAAELFAENGFTTTSTRAIADAVGLRQASLFHYFARKEDMLIELLDRTVRPTLDVVHRLKLENYDPELALWHLIRVDTTNLCRATEPGRPPVAPRGARRRNSNFSGDAAISSSASMPDSSLAATTPAPFARRILACRPTSCSGWWKASSRPATPSADDLRRPWSLRTQHCASAVCRPAEPAPLRVQPAFSIRADTRVHCPETFSNSPGNRRGFESTSLTERRRGRLARGER